jgi:DNA-binding LytR/AlgR family response regulator
MTTAVNNHVWVLTTQCNQKFKMDDVLFFKSENKKCLMYTNTGDTHTVLHSLAELEEMFNNGHFIRVHRSYLINSHYVVRYFNKSLLLELLNQNIIPIAREKKSVVEAFILGRK